MWQIIGNIKKTNYRNYAKFDFKSIFQSTSSPHPKKTK